MQRAAAEALPRDFGYEWTGVTYQELSAGSIATIVLALAIFFVFMILAAQYESWSMPFMVLSSAPLALIGALGAIWVRQMQVDVYSQIGFVMLIGLAAKNAILIVEFAKRRREEGLSIVEAAMEAGRLRLRPILMTAFAFIFGVLPLMFATGAGAASRQSLGTAVFGGMLAATALTLCSRRYSTSLIERAREGRRADARRRASRRPSTPQAPPNDDRSPSMRVAEIDRRLARRRSALAAIVGVRFAGDRLDGAKAARADGDDDGDAGAGRRRSSRRRCRSISTIPAASRRSAASRCRRASPATSTRSRRPTAPTSRAATCSTRSIRATCRRRSIRRARRRSAIRRSLEYAQANFSRGEELAEERLCRQGRLRSALQHDAGRRGGAGARSGRDRRRRRSTSAIPKSARRSPAGSGATRRPRARWSVPRAGALNTLVQLDPVYVTFNPSETELAEIEKARAAARSRRKFPRPARRRSRARANSPSSTTSSTERPARSSRASPSPIPISRCCRANMCASGCCCATSPTR